MGISQRYTAGTGCWRVVQAGRPTCADADAPKRPILVFAWPPAGPREARVLVKPFISVLYYHRPAGSDLYASDCGYRDPKTPHRRRFQSKMTRDPRVAHDIVHARRVRPSRGPHAPHIAGGHPLDDPLASGTTSWPSWPTRSPCRPASGPTPPTLAGPVWPAGGSGSAATQPPAVPAP